ncbi:MAG: FliA/WhiG family RNA polymerase sigma factor [Vicinamibacterales bacterium]|nr:FliA/WhiG family RNA polymerase sigma factor [Vicinamibacterales bacterium]
MRLSTPEASLPERDRLVVAHVGLVKALAQRLARRLPSQVEVADLVSIGVLGLVEAAGRYKPATGVPFDAFARRRVQGAMLDALRDLDWAPRSLRKLRRHVDGTLAQLRSQLGREPSEPELAQALDMTESQYAASMEQLRSLEVAMVRPLDDTGSDRQSLLEICIDPDVGPEVRLERRELRGLLASAIKQLPERERQVLALYYEEEMTMAEIGEVLGVCESRVSQLRSLAISRLRTSLRETVSLAKAS